MPVANTVIAMSVPSDKRSLAFGFSSSVGMLGNVAGPFFSGFLAMQYGYGSVFWSTAFVFFVAALLVRSSYHHVMAAQKKMRQ
jgi:MFS transporter, DHA1 family, multidrug resistance protein